MALGADLYPPPAFDSRPPPSLRLAMAALYDSSEKRDAVMPSPTFTPPRPPRDVYPSAPFFPRQPTTIFLLAEHEQIRLLRDPSYVRVRVNATSKPSLVVANPVPLLRLSCVNAQTFRSHGGASAPPFSLEGLLKSCECAAPRAPFLRRLRSYLSLASEAISTFQSPSYFL
eukprot:4012303-Pleurochrysis_carterae.AAC.1